MDRDASDSTRLLLLGVDPGGASDHTGLCLLHPTGRTDRLPEDGGGIELHRFLFLDALALIEGRASEIAVAVVEDSRRLPLYAKHRKAPREARDRIARSVGQVDAHTADLCVLLTRLSIPYVLRTPAPGTGKWTADYFLHVTRYPAETDQHERDAASLVFGYTCAALLREAERQAAERTTVARTSLIEPKPTRTPA